jgi:cation diffusion facilitator family transporter
MSVLPEDACPPRNTASKIVYASVALNVALMTMQIIIGKSAHSDGMLADGLHSLIDLVADALVLVTLRLGAMAEAPGAARRRVTSESMASLALGALLMAMGADMLWRAVERIGSASEAGVDPTAVGTGALAVAALALCAKEALFQFMAREAKRTGSAILLANAWHARSDAVSSLLVLIGIAGSLAGFPALDELAASIIGLMVLRIGCGFAWSAWQGIDGPRREARAAAARRRTLR